MSTIAVHTRRMMTKTATRSFEIQPLGPYSLEESANFIGAWHQAAGGTDTQPRRGRPGLAGRGAARSSRRDAAEEISRLPSSELVERLRSGGLVRDVGAD